MYDDDSDDDDCMGNNSIVLAIVFTYIMASDALRYRCYFTALSMSHNTIVDIIIFIVVLMFIINNSRGNYIHIISIT